ncbi:hypothetical protein DL93DRAFT_1952241 [Clavulina sp. PMI_390]|nr:hypothetical protein DL93DRAFT_1952241 [Clavulina sp. PMI_390]
MIVDNTKTAEAEKRQLRETFSEQENAAPPAYDARDPSLTSSPNAGSSRAPPPPPPTSPPPDAVGSEVSASDVSPSQTTPGRSVENMNARIQANPFLTPPTNFVSVVEGNGAVKGSWTIDTSLSPPTALLAPIPAGLDIRPNLSINCSNGAINANVRFVRGDEQPRGLVSTVTHNGTIRVAVMSRGQQRVWIRCRSSNGAVKVLLPRDFNGLFAYRARNGTVNWSTGVNAAKTTFSLDRGVGKGFIGDWANANLDGLNSDVNKPLPSPDTSQVTRSHSRQRSASSLDSDFPHPSFPDPEVRVWSPDAREGSELHIPSRRTFSGSAVSSSTLSPDQSASQVGVGENLSPTPLHDASRTNGLRIPLSRSTTPVSGSVVSSTAASAASGSDSLLDDTARAWQGDMLEIDCENGTIKIAFVDEPKDHGRTGSLAIGAAKFVKGWLADRGMSADRFTGLTREASMWVKGS